MNQERDPDENPQLDKEPDRGDVSKDGFGDYDKEANPKQVDIDGQEPSPGKAERQPATGRVTPAGSAEGDRFEVHFRMMKLRI